MGAGWGGRGGGGGGVEGTSELRDEEAAEPNGTSDCVRRHLIYNDTHHRHELVAAGWYKHTDLFHIRVHTNSSITKRRRR